MKPLFCPLCGAEDTSRFDGFNLIEPQASMSNLLIDRPWIGWYQRYTCKLCEGIFAVNVRRYASIANKR